MTRNVELLTRVRDLIREDPSKLDMSDWARPCGTTACIAGWAVQLAGDKLEFGDHQVVSRAQDGTLCDVDTRAADLLGLNEYEVNALFYCENEDAIPYLTDLIAGDDIVNGDIWGYGDYGDNWDYDDED
jgi:hypothetical protein